MFFKPTVQTFHCFKTLICNEVEFNSAQLNLDKFK